MYTYEYKEQVKRGFASRNPSKKMRLKKLPNPNYIPVSNRFEKLIKTENMRDNFVSSGRRELGTSADAASPNVRVSRSKRKYSINTDKTHVSRDTGSLPKTDLRHRSKGSYDRRPNRSHSLSNVYKVKEFTRTQVGCKSTWTPRHKMQGHSNSNSKLAWSNAKCGTNKVKPPCGGVSVVRNFRERRKVFVGFRGKKFNEDKMKMKITISVGSDGIRRVVESGKISWQVARGRGMEREPVKWRERRRDRVRSLERWKLPLEMPTPPRDDYPSAKKRSRAEVESPEHDDERKRLKAPKFDNEGWDAERMEKRREKHRRRREKVRERKKALLKKARRVKTTNRMKKEVIPRRGKKRKQVEQAQQCSPGSSGSTGSPGKQPSHQANTPARGNSLPSRVKSSVKKARVDNVRSDSTQTSVKADVINSNFLQISPKEACERVLSDLLNKMFGSGEGGGEKSPGEGGGDKPDKSEEEERMEVSEDYLTPDTGEEDIMDTERTSPQAGLPPSGARIIITPPEHRRPDPHLPPPAAANWDSGRAPRISENYEIREGPPHICELCGSHQSSDGELKVHVDDEHDWFIQWSRVKKHGLPTNVARAINWEGKVAPLIGECYLDDIELWPRIVADVRERYDAEERRLLALPGLNSIPDSAAANYSYVPAIIDSKVGVPPLEETSELRSPQGGAVITGLSGTGTGEDLSLVDNIKREDTTQLPDYPEDTQTPEDEQEEAPLTSGASGYDSRVYYRDANGIGYAHKVLKNSIKKKDYSIWNNLPVKERKKFNENEKEAMEKERAEKAAEDMFYQTQTQTQTSPNSPNLLEELNNVGSGESQLPSESMLERMDTSASPTDGQDGTLQTVTESQAREMMERREREEEGRKQREEDDELFRLHYYEDFEKDVQFKEAEAAALADEAQGGTKRGRQSSGNSNENTPIKPAAKISRKASVVSGRGRGTGSKAGHPSRPTRSASARAGAGKNESLVLNKRGGATKGGVKRGAASSQPRKVPVSVSNSASPELSENVGTGSQETDAGSQGGEPRSQSSTPVKKIKKSSGTATTLVVTSLTEKVKKGEAKIKEMKIEVKKIKAKLNDTEVKLTDALAERSTAIEERDEANRRCADMAKTNNASKEKQRLAELKTEEKATKVASLKNEVADLKDKVNSLTRNIKIEQGKVSLEQKRNAELSKKIKEGGEKEKKRSVAAPAGNQPTTAQANHNAQLREMREQLDNAKEDLNNLEEEKARDLERLNKIVDELNVQVRTQDVFNASLKEQRDNLAADVERKERKIQKLIRDIKKGQEEVERNQAIITKQSESMASLRQERSRIEGHVRTALSSRSSSCSGSKCGSRSALSNIAKIGSGAPPAPLVTERDQLFAEERRKRIDLQEENDQLKREFEGQVVMIKEACRENDAKETARQIMESERNSALDLLDEHKRRSERFQKEVAEMRKDHNQEIREYEVKVDKLWKQIKEGAKQSVSTVGSNQMMDRIESLEGENERLQRALQYSDEAMKAAKRDSQTLQLKLAQARARIPCSTKDCTGTKFDENDGKEKKCQYAAPHGKGGLLGHSPAGYFRSGDAREKRGTYCNQCDHCNPPGKEFYCTQCEHCNPSSRSKEEQRKLRCEREDDERRSREAAVLNLPRRGQTLSSGRVVGTSPVTPRERTLRLSQRPTTGRTSSTPPSGGLKDNLKYKLKGRKLSSHDAKRKLPNNFVPGKTCHFWPGNCSQEHCRFEHPDEDPEQEEEEELSDTNMSVDQGQEEDDVVLEEEYEYEDEVFEKNSERIVVERSEDRDLPATPETPRDERRGSSRRDRTPPARERRKSPSPEAKDRRSVSVSFSRTHTLKTISTDDDGLDREARKSYREDERGREKKDRRDSTDRPLDRRESQSRKRERENDDHAGRQRSKSQKRNPSPKRVRPKLKPKNAQGNGKRVPVSGAGAQKEQRKSQTKKMEETHTAVKAGTSKTMQERLLSLVDKDKVRLSRSSWRRSRSRSRSSAASSRASSVRKSRSRSPRSQTRSQTRSRTRSPTTSSRRRSRSMSMTPRRSRDARRSPTVDKVERSMTRSVSRGRGGESSPATSPKRNWKAERGQSSPRRPARSQSRRNSSRRRGSNERRRERTPSPYRGKGGGRKGEERRK